MTETGLTPLNLSQLNTFQQVQLLVPVIIGSPILVSWLVVLSASAPLRRDSRRLSSKIKSEEASGFVKHLETPPSNLSTASRFGRPKSLIIAQAANLHRRAQTLRSPQTLNDYD